MCMNEKNTNGGYKGIVISLCSYLTVRGKKKVWFLTKLGFSWEPGFFLADTQGLAKNRVTIDEANFPF
jgi:hypothetical protein